MRIAISNSRVAFGGGENWSLTAAVGLIRRGHEVFLFCHPDSKLRRRADRAEGVQPVPIRVRGTGDLIAVARGTQLLRRHRIEIVCANLEKEVRMLGLSAKMAGVPFVRRRGSDRGFRDTWGNRVTFRNLVSGIIVNSDATKKSVLERSDWIPEDNVVRIYNGIPETFHPDERAGAAMRLQLGLTEDAQVVGMVGALSTRKGHATLFEAAAGLRERHPSLRLLIVGWVPDTSRAPAEAERIRSRCTELGLDDITTFADPVDDPNAVYNALDILAMPSTNEGFGYVAAEAMRAGVPTVVSDASSLPEVAGDEGCIVPAEDAPAWERALGELLSDPQRREALGAAGRKRVETVFSIEAMISALETYFESLLRAPKRRPRLTSHGKR